MSSLKPLAPSWYWPSGCQRLMRRRDEYGNDVRVSRAPELAARANVGCGRAYRPSALLDRAWRGSLRRARMERAGMVVTVCPSGVAATSPERVWAVLTTPERFGQWLQDAAVVSINPRGPAAAGQRIDLAARGFGRQWPVTIEVGAVDAGHRWIDLTVRLPFGIINREHVTLAELSAERTLVRFN